MPDLFSRQHKCIFYTVRQLALCICIIKGPHSASCLYSVTDSVQERRLRLLCSPPRKETRSHDDTLSPFLVATSSKEELLYLDFPQFLDFPAWDVHAWLYCLKISLQHSSGKQQNVIQIVLFNHTQSIFTVNYILWLRNTMVNVALLVLLLRSTIFNIFLSYTKSA